jgi:DNA-binding NarL/FixJ family response regulator
VASLCDLTARETEILQMIIAGKANKDIAGDMRITEKTVEFHLDHIYTKIGVRTRLLAGVWALQQGLEVETDDLSN